MAKHKPLPAPPLPDKLVALASWVDLHDRETAEWLRAAAANHGPPIDGNWKRKQTLRRIWREHLSSVEHRSTAARLIAGAWASLGDEEHRPGSMEDLLAGLTRAGCPPLRQRWIDHLLDPAFDR